MLHNFTSGINFIALVVALWLGLYLVTRNPRRPETWLSALAIWSMGGYFFNQLLALHPLPTPPAEMRTWLHHLILFWPRDVFELGWLQGWLPTYGIFFWYHATLYMLPGRFHPGRLTLALIGYGIALVGILIKASDASAWINLGGDPIYISSLRSPLLPLFILAFLSFAGLSALNLALTMRASPGVMPREQFRLFLYATLLGGVAAFPGMASYFLNRPVPQVLPATFLFMALLLTGVGVARYNALIDRRSLQRDFLYSAAEAGAILLVYMFFFGVFMGFYPLPVIAFVFVGCLAVISHSMIDMARFQLDRLYLKNQNHKLRLRLRQLTKIIRDSEGVGVLGTVLEVIGSSVSATWAVVLRWTRDGLIPIGEWNWVGETLESALPSDVVRELMMEDLSELGPQQFPPPFEEAAIIVPLYEEDQIGALLVGPSRNQRGYSETEMESLRDAGDILTNLLRTPPVEGQALTRLEEAALSGLIDQVCLSEEDLIRLVAMSLRKLHDYQYLGSTPLVRLRVVESCLECTESGPTNHIDLGKAVSIVLRDAVDQLRPDQDEPTGSLPRNWYPYIILRDAYLNGVPNREIMARLYISEGTFNRTRRDAIRSVARLLNEMEAAMV